jgi:CrcB protein
VLAQALVVGAGGFVGAALRYAVGVGALRWLGAGFPFATFLVNVTGCFMIGLLAAWFDRTGAGLTPRLFWLAGVLGGYTTFSTFGFETLALLRGGAPGAAAINVAGQVLLGLAAVAAGAALARALS